MKKINYFDAAPNGQGWLHKQRPPLKPGELVLVNGHIMRYSTERQGLDHVLTPVDGPTANKRH